MLYLRRRVKQVLWAATVALVLVASGASAQQPPATVEFHLECYPERYIRWSRMQSWASENCDSYTATYLRSYQDNNYDLVFVVRIDGKLWRLKPRRVNTFQPLDQWERGDHMEVEFDGYFQDKMVRHLVQYWGIEHADDYEFMRDVLSWDTRYLHLNLARE